MATINEDMFNCSCAFWEMRETLSKSTEGDFVVVLYRFTNNVHAVLDMHKCIL